LDGRVAFKEQVELERQEKAKHHEEKESAGKAARTNAFLPLREKYYREYSEDSDDDYHDCIPHLTAEFRDAVDDDGAF